MAQGYITLTKPYLRVGGVNIAAGTYETDDPNVAPYIGRIVELRLGYLTGATVGQVQKAKAPKSLAEQAAAIAPLPPSEPPVSLEQIRDEMTVDELEAHATEYQIDIAGKRLKADLIDAIATHWGY